MELLESVGKCLKTLRLILGFRQHIKQVFNRFITVRVGRADENIPLCIDNIGESRVLVERQTEAFCYADYLILFHKTALCAVSHGYFYV